MDLWYLSSQFSSVAPKQNNQNRAISWPFAIRTARLLTAWLRYRSYVVGVGLQRSLPTIPECLCYSASSFARSKQDEEAKLLRRQGSFLTYELV